MKRKAEGELDFPSRKEKMSKPELDKDKKYDRQLRLWGNHGQEALESAKICLINASATGTEILKNLVLPGIGSFTVVDGHRVSGEDSGNNFFFDKDSIGKSRAECATELLQELNSDVCGDFLEETPEKLLQNNPDFFNSFTVVIATQLPEETLLRLASTLWSASVPLLVCRCYGFIGYMRIVVKEHTVVESHPDNSHEDLRLDKPFPGLKEYVDSLDFSTMSKVEHSHTPYVAILLKYLIKWKAEHEDKPPQNYREKGAFKEMIREGILKNKDGVPEEEENFDEAIKATNMALVPTRIPSNVQSILNDERCENITESSSSFWIIAKAVKEFVENEGEGTLPLRGSIPDMTADSKRYIELQNVYQEQSGLDVQAVMQRVHGILLSFGKSLDAVPEMEIKQFCKNAHFLHVVRCRSLAEEYEQTSTRGAEIAWFTQATKAETETAHPSVSACASVSKFSHLKICDVSSTEAEVTKKKKGRSVPSVSASVEHPLELPPPFSWFTLERCYLDNPENEVVFYVLLRAADRFYHQYKRYPGHFEDQVEADVVKLKACVSSLLQEWSLNSNIKEEYVHEMCRYGASELHPVAAFMGGAAAQEVVKLVTHQFVPFNNTYIYNGMSGTSVTIQ